MEKFYFEGEEHRFDARYIGNAPTKNTEPDTVLEAVCLLHVKLDKMQQRALEKAVAMAYGEGSQSSSRKMQTISKRFRKAGKDVRLGDVVTVTMTATTVTVSDGKGTAEGTQFFESRKVKSAEVMDKGGKNKPAEVAFLVQVGTKYICHVLSCLPAVADELQSTLLESSKAGNRVVRKESEINPEVMQRLEEEKAAELSDASNHTITFGVGLKRRSSLKVSAGLRRRGSVNLSGKGASVANRSSNSFGGTLATLESADEREARDQLDESLGSEAAADDDSSLLEFDESIFGDDVLADDVLEENETFGDSGFGDALNDINFDNFGFDGEDDDGEEFGF